MHRRHCLLLADRIHAVLLHSLGAGVDRHRMLMDERYRQDVLLVCDGLQDTPGPLLAHHFRRAAELPDERPAAATPNPALAERVVNTLLGRHMVTTPTPAGGNSLATT
jgi:hypothetical protein